MRFIYVFDTSVVDFLVSKKYLLLKSDKKNKIYVFENKPTNDALVLNVLAETDFVLSDTLTF